MILKDILSLVLRSCPGTALAKIIFGCSILDSYFSILFSSSLHSFLFKNLQDWTLNGKIVDSYFSTAIFLLTCSFKQQLQEWTLGG